MRKINWLSSADEDLYEITSYLLENASPEITAQVLKQIYDSVDRLSIQPYMGVEVDDEDMLEWNIPKLKYTIPYRINDGDIEILRVFHQGQNKPSRWEQGNT